MKFQVYWRDDHCELHLSGEFETLDAALVCAEDLSSRMMSWERVEIYEGNHFVMEVR